jgi:hypothetical protein
MIILRPTTTYDAKAQGTHASVYIFLFATFIDHHTYHPIVQLNADITVSSFDSRIRGLQSPFFVSQ